jgi:hypothetical protein
MCLWKKQVLEKLHPKAYSNEEAKAQNSWMLPRQSFQWKLTLLLGDAWSKAVNANSKQSNRQNYVVHQLSPAFRS